MPLEAETCIVFEYVWISIIGYTTAMGIPDYRAMGRGVGIECEFCDICHRWENPVSFESSAVSL